MTRRKNSLLCCCALAAAAAAGSCVFVSFGSKLSLPRNAQTSGGEKNFDFLRVASYSGKSPEINEEANTDFIGQAARWLGAGLLAGVLAAGASVPAAEAFFPHDERWAPYPNVDIPKLTLSTHKKTMTLCKDNKKFKKLFKDRIFKIKSRMKKYPASTVAFKNKQRELNRATRRQEDYGERLCGIRDGLPRVLIDPAIRRGGALAPSLMFLYIAGWIGWAGREYLLRTASVEKEIIIDVPLALTCMASGFAWPVNTWQDIVNGDFVARDEDIRGKAAGNGYATS
uniref:Photosystem I reaction center subunit III n=1 Tax=Polykrikos lebourae TaxID=370573 RepID=A0A0K0TN05_9DINO|nr:chloroplast photosystem 2 subunit 3 [Polykrikos lebourae]